MLETGKVVKQIKSEYFYFKLSDEEIDKIAKNIVDEEMMLIFQTNNMDVVRHGREINSAVMRYMALKEPDNYNDYVQLKNDINDIISNYIKGKNIKIDKNSFSNRIIKLMMNNFGSFKEARENISVDNIEWMLKKYIDDLNNNLKHGNNNKFSVSSYVYDYMDYYNNEYNTDKLSARVVDRVCIDVANQLIDRGYTDKMIANHEADREIGNLIKLNLMKSKSLGIGKNKKRHKVTLRKEVKNTIIISMILLAVTSVMLSIDSHIKEKSNGEVGLVDIFKTKDVVDYDWPSIWTRSNNNYKETTSMVIQYYNNSDKFGNLEYNYLGFYKAYESIMDDRLFIMDDMLMKIQNREGLEISENLAGYSCYLDFVYDRIISNEYKTEDELGEYLHAINEYKRVLEDHPGEVVMHILSPELKEQIEEFMDIYRDMSNRLEREYNKYRKTDEAMIMATLYEKNNNTYKPEFEYQTFNQLDQTKGGYSR